MPYLPANKPKYLVVDYRGSVIAKRHTYAGAQETAETYTHGTYSTTRIYGPAGDLRWTCKPKPVTVH